MKKTYIQIMRELREDNDRTQQEVADYLGTSQTMYARYERGANELPVLASDQIMRILSCILRLFSRTFSE